MSALFLGPLVTVFSLSHYVSSRHFFTYFFNILGYIHFILPGVFVFNPFPNIVNLSLWTVPYELECYITLTVLTLVSVTFKRPRVFLSIFIIGCILVCLMNRGYTIYGQAVPGRSLILYFLAGVAIQMWKEKIPYSEWLFAGSLIAAVLFMTSDVLLYLSPLPIAYITVYLGLTQPKRVPLLMSGDYSYGIYLYAFPIQQTVALKVSHVWYYHIMIALPLTFMFAAFSWHTIEKPTLRLKRLLSGRALPLPYVVGENRVKRARRFAP